MKKRIFAQWLWWGPWTGLFFCLSLEAQSAPNGGAPIRVRWRAGGDAQEGLEFQDTARGVLARYVDFARDNPFADLRLPLSERVGPYCTVYDLSGVPAEEVCRALGFDRAAYAEQYGTDRFCPKGIRVQAQPEINGPYVAVNYRMLLYGGEGELWQAACPHFIGIKSHVRVYDRWGNPVFDQSFGWHPLTGAQATEDGRYLVLASGETPGDVPFFQQRFTEGSVWDLRTGKALDRRWFADATLGDRQLRAQGKWVVQDILYWNGDSKERRQKSIFYDFDGKAKYERDVPYSGIDHTRQDSEGFFWEDARTKKVVRRELILTDLKKSPLY